VNQEKSRGGNFRPIAELSARNKPVFSCAGSSEQADRQMLGHKAILYQRANDLKKKLAFRSMDGDFNCYRDDTPERGMSIF
jgi:hypothetical protein